MVDWYLTQPTKRWARALFMAVALTVAVGIARLIPNGVVVGVLGGVILLATCPLMLNRAWTVSGTAFKVLAVVALTAAVVPAVAAFMVAESLGMEANGTRHTVTVTSERKVRPLLQRSSDWHYTLNQGGMPLPGELVTGTDEFDPGEVIEVYSDGEEYMPADDVDEVQSAVVVAGASYLIALPLMAAAGYFAPMGSLSTPVQGRGRPAALRTGN